MTPDPEKKIQSANNTGRIEAFSDGVFAIAITLLILELKVPHIEPVTGSALWRGLGQEWPGYFALLTSFGSVLIMWVHHHAFFRLARRADAPLLFANGFLLLMVTVVPFPTAVVARYLATGAARAAAGFYGGVFVLLAISFYLLLRVVLGQCHLSIPMVKRLRNGYRFGPMAYLAAALAAPISAWLSLGICTVLWIYWGAMAFRLEPCDEEEPVEISVASKK
jgi:uncharacterized membrane protein